MIFETEDMVQGKSWHMWSRVRACAMPWRPGVYHCIVRAAPYTLVHGLCLGAKLDRSVKSPLPVCKSMEASPYAPKTSPRVCENERWRSKKGVVPV